MTGGVGSAGLGDPYVPLAGNGGYDVGHYQLDLRYDPATRLAHRHRRHSATATSGLSRFDLDLRGLTASSVSVDGQGAQAPADGDELVVTPKAPLGAGRQFVTTIVYGGTPKPYEVPGLGEAAS